MLALPLNQILLGDCLKLLKNLPDASISCVITDPPYGLGTREPTGEEIIAYLEGATLDTKGDFMGQNWSIPPVAVWKECFRVLKPGGHLLSFGSTRTFDLISIGIRAAGFENRDTVASFFGSTTLAWIQSQGFPKSLSIEKAMLKAGVAPDVAAKWSGYGTSLKPSFEPILVFRKPIEEKTVAAQVLKTGMGGMNIDAVRISSGPSSGGSSSGATALGQGSGWNAHNNKITDVDRSMPKGRWPANIVLIHSPGCKIVGFKKVSAPVINRFEDGMKPFGDGAGHAYTSTPTGDKEGKEEIPVYKCEDGCPVKLLDEQSGKLKSGKFEPWHKDSGKEAGCYGSYEGREREKSTYGDVGGASRFFGQIQPDAPFFYTGKVSRKERGGWFTKVKPEYPLMALREDLSDAEREHIFEEWPENYTSSPEVTLASTEIPEGFEKYFSPILEGSNPHPSMKPLKLMEWVVKLVCPKGATVLDPYAGTGTTCVAALSSGCQYIGIERDPEFHEVATKRIAALKTELEVKLEKEAQQESFNLMLDLPEDE